MEPEPQISRRKMYQKKTTEPPRLLKVEFTVDLNQITNPLLVIELAQRLLADDEIFPDQTPRRLGRGRRRGIEPINLNDAAAELLHATLTDAPVLQALGLNPQEMSHGLDGGDPPIDAASLKDAPAQ